MQGRVAVVFSIGLALCGVPAWVGTTSAGAEGERGMRQALRSELNRLPGPYEVSRAPVDGQALTTNPPVFVWLPIEGMEEYVVQYSQDPELPDSSTTTVNQSGVAHRVREKVPYSGAVEISYVVPVTTVAVLRETISPGIWYWRYGCDAGNGRGVVFSDTWQFSLAPDATPLPFPDVGELVARASRSRPRLFVTPEDVERFRELGRTTMSDEVERMKRRCDRHLGEDLLPEPPFLPWDGDWGPPFTKVMQETRRFQSPMVVCAQLYLVTGDEKYGLEAKRRLMHLMSWDPKGSTSLGENDEPGHEIVRSSTLTYDYIYPLLTPEEREQCRQCLAVRMPQLYLALRSNPFEVNPFDSHAMDYFLNDLTQACLAMAGELAVEEWLEYCLTMMWAPFYPPFGGADGGWSEGPSYWGWSTYRFMHGFRLVQQSSGMPIYERPWVRNTGYYKLYGNPPCSKMSPFGDGQAYGSLAGADAMWVLGTVLRDPYLIWSAEQRDYSPSALEAFLFHDERVPGRPPSDLPQARCFDDVGLACMHSDLAHGHRNVQVLLHSSPYGTISHSYADENAFTLDAFGEPLAIASGYYPYYSSPHHDQWTRQTKASNCITVDGEGQPPRDWNAKGRITAFETDDYCHYARGDASAAYKGRLKEFDRHILYLRPLDGEMYPVIVILDDLWSAKASTYQWWLHSLEEMEVNSMEQTVRITRNQAQLDLQFLTPAGLTFSQTDQFAVPPEGDPERYPNQSHLAAETTTPSERARFLTVLFPHHADQGDPGRTARLLRGDGYLGAEVTAQGRRHVVVFRTEPGGREPITVAGAELTGSAVAQSWDASGQSIGGCFVAPPSVDVEAP
jgi:hypothetical protein